MRMAVVKISDNLVTNVIELEPGADWNPPAGHSIRLAGNANPGDIWSGTEYIKPPPPPPDPDIALYAAATTVDAKLEILKRRSGL